MESKKKLKQKVYLIGSDESNFAADIRGLRLIASIHRVERICAIFLTRAECYPAIESYCCKNRDGKINLNELLSIAG